METTDGNEGVADSGLGSTRSAHDRQVRLAKQKPRWATLQGVATDAYNASTGCAN